MEEKYVCHLNRDNIYMLIMNFVYSEVEQQQYKKYVIQAREKEKSVLYTNFSMSMQIELNPSDYAASDSHSSLSALFHVK